MKNLLPIRSFTSSLCAPRYSTCTRWFAAVLSVLIGTAAFGSLLPAPASDFLFGISSIAIASVRKQTARALSGNATAVRPLDVSLNFARAGHSATMLTDGRILIVGGENQNGFVTEAEIFDPITGSFSISGNLSLPRADHSATRLPDGRVLIVGGRGNLGSFRTTEIFDPTSGAFTNGPSLNNARSGHSATALADGRIVFAGGDAAASAEILDLSAGISANAGSLNGPRSMHGAAAMLDGRILFVGGRDADGNPLTSSEIFNSADGSCARVESSLRVARVRPHLRVLFDGKVQVIGGSDDGSLEVYDPHAGVFGAYAHVAPEGDTCAGLSAQIESSQTRAALFHNGQSNAAFDRTRHTINELTGQAIVTGGSDTSGAALTSAPLFRSSDAEISTDKLDYAPGETVYITGRGFEPGETVRIKIHEDPHTPLERGSDLVADAEGNFGGQYDVQDYDLHMKFLVGARGLTSGRTAQTAFTDASPGSLGNYATAGLASAPVPTSVSPSNVATNVTFSNLTRGSGLTGVGTANAFNSSSWTSSASPDANDYYEFTITPDSTYEFSASELRVGLERSTTGPASAVLRSSLDGYTANIGSVISVPTSIAASTINLSGVSGLQNSTSAVTLRLYAYGSTSTAGSLRIQRITSVSPNVGLEVDGTVASSCVASLVTLQPTNQTFTYGDASVSFTSTASGTPAPTVHWQENTGSGFTNLADGGGVSGATTTTLMISNPTPAMSGYQYRAVFTNTCGSVNSSAATLTVNKAGSTTTITCASDSVYTGSTIEPCTYTVTGNEAGNPVLVASTPVPSGNYATNINAGINTGLASFNYPGDANHNGSSDTENFSIDKAPTYITPDSNVDGVNNDCIGNTHTATLTDAIAGQDLGGISLKMTIGGQSITTTTNSSELATFTLTLFQAPGGTTQRFELNQMWTDPNRYAPAAVTRNFTVSGDPNIGPGVDATSLYTGSLFFWTTSSASSTATLTLSATIMDAFNLCPTGDITKAQVSFYISTNGGGSFSPVSNAQNLPVGLANPNEPNVGTASTISQYNIGNNQSVTLMVRVVVGGYYASNSSTYDLPITIGRPGAVNSLMGGGQLTNDGVPFLVSGYLGMNSLSCEFGSQVQYNKSGTNPQGQVTVTITSCNRSNGTLEPGCDGTTPNKWHHYFIKSNSISELALISGSASFGSKTNVSEIFADGTKVGLDGGNTMQLMFTPKGKAIPRDMYSTPQSDSFADSNRVCTADGGCASIVIFRSNGLGGGVWYSSSWGQGSGTTVPHPYEKAVVNGGVAVAAAGNKVLSVSLKD